MCRTNFYGAGHHEAASKFFDQKQFRLKIQQRLSLAPDTLATPVRFNEERTSVAIEVHEIFGIFNSVGFVARLGANQIGTQRCNRSRRQLCSDRPNRERHAGLFDEV